MSEPTEVPRHITDLAEQRERARRDRDFAGADLLRENIEDQGWLVTDTDDGFDLAPKPPFEVWPSVEAVPDSAVGPAPGGETAESDKDVAKVDDADNRSGAQAGVGGGGGMDEPARGPGTEPMVASQVLWDSSLAVSRLDEAVSAAGGSEEYERTPSSAVTVGLLVDGWPADLRKCVGALVAHTDARILALDLGNVDGAGTVLHELAQAHPGRIEELHVAEAPHWRSGSAGWGAARTKLMRIDTADIHVIMDTSTILDGDAIGPLVAAIEAGATAAGWQGVDPDDGEKEWHQAGPGRVRALLGHLMAVRREAALEAGGFNDKATYHRNADLEFSLALPGDLVVPERTLPVHQERHRAYEDVDPGYRDRESRRTYDRVLDRLRSGPGAGTP